jgi:hypothetical protein
MGLLIYATVTNNFVGEPFSSLTVSRDDTGVNTGDLTSIFFGDFMLWEMGISCIEKHGISMIDFFKSYHS